MSSGFLKTVREAETTAQPASAGFRETFSNLIGNRDEIFFQGYWEKHPVFFDRQKLKDNLINEDVFSRKKLLEIVDEIELPVETNLSAVNYIAQTRQAWPFSSNTASTKEIKSAFKNSYTVQFFQPQRFSDELHQINAGFEHVFGSLAGASAYLTPPNSQGLAPHHDDVDVFVLQVKTTSTYVFFLSQLSFILLFATST